MPTSPAGLPPHLLLVDDNVDQLRLLIEALRSARYRLSIARDGAQAYARAIASQPDLILMDVHMPGMDGFSACRLLKSNPATQDIPLIFLTSAGELDSRLEGLNNGAVDYVIKPFASAEVLARVRIHLKKPESAIGEPALAKPSLSADQVLVQAAIQYLSERLAHPPTVKALARQIGTNEKRLSRAFGEHLGVTVFEFIRNERVRTARRLLTETTLRVADIAEEIGFSSAANFATAFREKTGTTPSAYRQRQPEAHNGRDKTGSERDPIL